MKINQINEKGHRHGYWEDYWSSGKLWFKGNYDNDLPHGYWEHYYSNGNQSCKGNYENGMRYGLWKYYGYDGILREEIFYY
jgi:antitoxin component YwqK of YwqJK toxin-antitoxin module